MWVAVLLSAQILQSSSSRISADGSWFNPDSTEIKSIILDVIPPRIVQTRWTLEDVRNDYMAEAWTCKSRTWTWKWDEDEFNEDYAGSGSDEFKPVDAVYAALWAFCRDNKLAVEGRLPHP